MESVRKNTVEAFAYFSNEIYQNNIMLNGILRPDYREYLLTKNMYYKLALEALKTSL